MCIDIDIFAYIYMCMYICIYMYICVYIHIDAVHALHTHACMHSTGV